MNLTNRIAAFAKLGEILLHPEAEKFPGFGNEVNELKHLIETSWHTNAWFTPENVTSALKSLGYSLRLPQIEKWVNKYPLKTFEQYSDKVVAVVMAGNIPLVGFHDYLCVMISGFRFLGKLSSDDARLLPHIHKILQKIEPGFKGRAEFTNDRLENFNAVIATGSNNTARYFEYYFAKYPHIIRKNRNGVAVISGRESDEELAALGDDIFSYFGLGCRNVSKIFVPENYQYDSLFRAIEKYKGVNAHYKYMNNYDYNKSIFLINSVAHLDNGFLLITESTSIPSPISVLHFQTYTDLQKLKHELMIQAENIQCIVCADNTFGNSIPPGKTQKPALMDYADNVDTIHFLKELHREIKNNQRDI
ncbi:MAG: hypothetical protein K9H16_14080 [Bacteroidales bacterium]|nr:hypothetical protein [Bacteroidales bacterium]